MGDARTHIRDYLLSLVYLLLLTHFGGRDYSPASFVVSRLKSFAICYDQKLINSLIIQHIWSITSIFSLKNSLRSRQMFEPLSLAAI